MPQASGLRPRAEEGGLKVVGPGADGADVSLVTRASGPLLAHIIPGLPRWVKWVMTVDLDAVPRGNLHFPLSYLTIVGHGVLEAHSVFRYDQ